LAAQRCAFFFSPSSGGKRLDRLHQSFRVQVGGRANPFRGDEEAPYRKREDRNANRKREVPAVPLGGDENNTHCQYRGHNRESKRPQAKAVASQAIFGVLVGHQPELWTRPGPLSQGADSNGVASICAFWVLRLLLSGGQRFAENSREERVAALRSPKVGAI